MNWRVIRIAGAAAFAALAEGATVILEKIAKKREDEDADEINSWDEPESSEVIELTDPEEETESETETE